MKSLLKFAVGISMLFLNCSGPRVNYVARVKLRQLSEKDLYNTKVVADVLFDAEEINADSLKSKSRELFLRGIDDFKNKKNPAAAVALFKNSILTLPDAKTYYELGNALLAVAKNDESLNEARRAYEVAEELNFAPLSMLYYKRAISYALMRSPEIEELSYSVRRAFEYGFSDTSLLRSEKSLANFAASDRFRDLLRDVATLQVKGQATGLFDLYKSSFPPVGDIFEILPEQAAMQDYKQSMSYDFVQFVPEMESSSFGRSVSNDFIFVARLMETPVYTALLYSSVVYFGEELQPVYTKLVTYDAKGAIISAKIFSGQFSAERVKAGRFDKGRITVKEYKRIWSQPIDKVAFDQNSVKKYELQATAEFKIDASGRLIEESVPENFKDSLILVKS